MKKQERLQRASHMMRGKIIQAENIVPVLESVVYPNDRVVLEGDNQKQATFLSQALASVDPAIVHGLTMLIPAVSREEHLDLFEKGIAHELNFAFAGMQSVRLAKMLEDNQLKIGSIHTYLELYARLLVDLIPNVCLVAAEMADEDGNLFTGYSTEDTPILVEATAFKDGIVIVQVNDIVGKGALPRVDIPGDWVDIVVRSDEPYQMEALFKRDPAKIRDSHILIAMMTIKGIYAKHGVMSLNHGIGYNGAAIELILPTYGESLGLKGKICRHWVLNPHPMMIPAIEKGWVESIYAFGGEKGMEKYTEARSDIFFTGILRDERVQLPDHFIGIAETFSARRSFEIVLRQEAQQLFNLGETLLFVGSAKMRDAAHAIMCHRTTERLG
jgi:malonate decarboxylase alpha subunit